MNSKNITRIIDWMKEVEIGEGDLTSECISPYSRFITGTLVSKGEGMFSGREVIESLFKPIGKQLKYNWKMSEGDQLKPSSEIVAFEGNGSEILKVKRLIEWIAGRMSGIATSTKAVADNLKIHGKELVSGRTVSPIFESIDEIAFTTGGGAYKYHGLYDSIYITQDHLTYAGGVAASLNNVIEEVGDARKALRIEIEVNSHEQFIEADDSDCDVVHLVDLSAVEIDSVFKKGNPKKMPVLHLNSMDDWKKEYSDYFFKFCAIESLHKSVNPVESQLVINKKEVKDEKTD